MLQQSKSLARAFKRELIVYRRVLADQRTPLRAKVFLCLALGYLCMPFDLIPDFIPVLGHLDDLVIVPALVYLALRFVPRELVAEHRTHIRHEAE
jgi:uncharacterized membrane protein YkvA (DUF1232 family)